ncbi:MAG: acetylxylan esterase [Bryobacteraceae bacterium]|nr:acetylxylan esterase [Bryobacteraceae bacterium]
MNRRLAAAITLWTAVVPLAAQNNSARALPPFTMPESIEVRQVDIYSEGVRMAGTLFHTKENAGRKLPSIIMAQGWGGTAGSLRRDAAVFAEAGFLVLTFDYRGWGASDARVILTGKKEPADKQNFRYSAEVQSIREVVSPADFVVDWQNAIHFLAGEPMCDPERIGLWGTSLSGGLVVSAAVRDSRVKAVHSQVPALDGRWTMATAKDKQLTWEESTRRARGELGYPSPGANTVARLIGAPIRYQFASWTPVEEIHRIPHVATQFVLAGKEELVDNKANGEAAYERAKGPRNMVVIPDIDHYGIYYNLEARRLSNRLAIEWFQKYLKSDPAK